MDERESEVPKIALHDFLITISLKSSKTELRELRTLQHAILASVTSATSSELVLIAQETSLKEDTEKQLRVLNFTLSSSDRLKD